uniref:Gypsy retrotransposon integrase-like protein 1 n=2 Tax=Hippocampus comes TaxID=109280 RepID=A0A3Q2Z869_HIPCM
MLEKIHEGHLGIEKCKKRARQLMFWPRMNQDIANQVSRCAICLKYQANQPAEPLHPHQAPDRPFQKVGADLFSCQGKDYLVVTAYYSLYPEVCRLQTATAEAVITCMKAIFSRHGIAHQVFSDNGPQFANEKFRHFAEEWDFKHMTSSPHFPQSNGLVESSVKTVKRLMHKAADSGTDFYRSLLVYRTTPLECGMSPAQLLMGRVLRSNLPVPENMLRTWEGEQVRVFKEQQKQKQKFYYDRGTRNLPELHTGDPVRYKDKTDTWSRKGTVLCQVQPRSYTVQTEEGAVLRRNRRDLLKDPALESQGTETVEGPNTAQSPPTETPQILRQAVRKS